MDTWMMADDGRKWFGRRTWVMWRYRSPGEEEYHRIPHWGKH